MDSGFLRHSREASTYPYGFGFFFSSSLLLLRLELSDTKVYEL
jgi:hypothetical protein